MQQSGMAGPIRRTVLELRNRCGRDPRVLSTLLRRGVRACFSDRSDSVASLRHGLILFFLPRRFQRGRLMPGRGGRMGFSEVSGLLLPRREDRLRSRRPRYSWRGWWKLGGISFCLSRRPHRLSKPWLRKRCERLKRCHIPGSRRRRLRGGLLGADRSRRGGNVEVGLLKTRRHLRRNLASDQLRKCLIRG